MPGTKSQIISNAVVGDFVIEPHLELMFRFLREKDRKQLLRLTCQMNRRKNSSYQERVKRINENSSLSYKSHTLPTSTSFRLL